MKLKWKKLIVLFVVATMFLQNVVVYAEDTTPATDSNPVAGQEGPTMPSETPKEQTTEDDNAAVPASEEKTPESDETDADTETDMDTDTDADTETDMDTDADTDMETDTDTEPQCTCGMKCMEDKINSECPVCGVAGADLADCEGEAFTDKMPAIAASRTFENLNVTVEIKAPEGAFPAGTTVSVTPVTVEGVEDALVAFDITFRDKDGEEIQPADGKRVEVNFSIPNPVKDMEADSAVLEVVHVTDEENMTGETVSMRDVNADDGDTVAVSVEAESFSTYALKVSAKSKENPKTYEDLLEALAAAGDGDTIQLGGDIEASATLEIAKSVTLDLAGYTLSLKEGESGSVIKVTGAGTRFTLTSSKEGGTIRAVTGGGVCVDNGNEFNMSGGTIKDCWAENGGGVYVANGSKFNMSGGTIKDCRAQNGGGVCVDGTYTMTDGTISDNVSFFQGGGVYISTAGAFNLEGGTITRNMTINWGGGVDNNGGAFNMSGGSITYNGLTEYGAHRMGAGVGNFRENSTFIMTGGEISNNGAESGYGNKICEDGGWESAIPLQGGGVFSEGTAVIKGGDIKDNIAQNGGGVYVAGGSEFNMSKGDITKNKASHGGGAWVDPGASLVMKEGVTISGNQAQYGGGVYVWGTFTRTGGVLCNNTASAAGADVYAEGKDAKVTLGTIPERAWALTGCNHYITGWYADTEKDRWADDNITEEKQTVQKGDVLAIKAAHGDNPTVVPTPDPTPEPTPDPTPGPTPGPTPEPTPGPTPGSTPEPTPGPTPEPTPEPTPGPIPTPVVTVPTAVTPVVPTAPALAATPAAATPEGPTIEALEEEAVPLAAGEREEGLELAALEDEEVPLAPGKGASWALINFALMNLAIFESLMLLIGYFVKTKNDNEDEEEKRKLKKKGIFRILSILVAVISLIAFILTEDITLPTAFVDKYTIVMLIIVIVQTVIVALSGKKYEDEEEEA